MKRSVFVASLYLGALASGARAAEVSVNGSATQSVDASNNYFLSQSPSGYTYRPLSRIDLGFLAAMPTTTYKLDTNYSYYKYLGPGANDTALTWGTPAGAKFEVANVQPRDKFDFYASWSRADLLTTVLQQTGSAAGRGEIDTYAAGGSVKHDLTRLDELSWSGNVSTVSYTDPAQTPYVDYTTSASWTHRLSPTTSLTSSANMDWLVTDDLANSQRLFWNPQVALQSQITKYLHFNGALGYDFVNAWQNGATQSNVTTGFHPLVGTASGWVGNIGFNYLLSKDTQVSFTAARSVTPTVLGQLQQIESIGSALSHTINSYSTLSLFAQFSRVSSAGTPDAGPVTTDAFSASAVYTYRLAREWRANLSYRYSQSIGQGGLANSNTVSIALIRDFNLYGKPPQAIPKTLSDLAQEDLMRAQQALPFIGP